MVFQEIKKYKLCWRIFIYLSFALLSMHWLTILILIVFVGIVWVPNMIKKDKSLSRYSEFKNYKSNSRIFYNEKIIIYFFRIEPAISTMSNVK